MIMPDLFDPNLLTLAAVILSVTATLILAGALWLEYNRYHNLLRLNSQASLETAKKKNTGILRRALAKAQEILGEAETESAELIAETRATRAKLDAKYEEEFAKYFEALKQMGEKAQVENQILLRQKSDELFGQFNRDLAAFLANTEQKSIQAMDAEVKSIRQTIDEYKKQQLSLIDENIIAMLERTLGLVLGKKISLNDQLDLVYEALDRAKAEKFIV